MWFVKYYETDERGFNAVGEPIYIWNNTEKEANYMAKEIERKYNGWKRISKIAEGDYQEYLRMKELEVELKFLKEKF